VKIARKKNHSIGLPISATKHATSKLSTFADLLTVATFGFRGEALRDRFYKISFRPKTYWINFHPQIVDKFPPKKQQIQVYLSVMGNTIRFCCILFKATWGHIRKPEFDQIKFFVLKFRPKRFHKIDSSSICALGSVTITTRHTSADVGSSVEFDHNGKIVAQKTTVRISSTRGRGGHCYDHYFGQFSRVQKE
jgi:hypothetical protein